MNIAGYSLKNRTVIWFISAMVFIAGIWAYQGLGKLEDPTFTIKTATVTTLYPGASAVEVENEVTETLESAIQKLHQLDQVRSLSRPGMSLIYVDILPEYDKHDLPQIWDELRRKVADAQSSLPPGAGPSSVNDAYGDVYGIYMALTGPGYGWNELEHTAKNLRRELLLVENVSDIQISGVQQEVIYIEIPRSRMAQLGFDAASLSGLLKAQNVVASSGSIHVGDNYLRIEPTGYFKTPEDIGELIISGTGPGAMRLRDIATVTRGYIDPMLSVMRHNGNPALGIGISATDGANVIEVGKAVRKRIEQLESTIPLGMELDYIYYQPGTVHESIGDFMINLIEAVAIVIAVLLVFMGIRSGILIGAVLLLTILATFVGMRLMNIELQSISLGALIIALGMLVDNAIVVVDGILVGIEQKKDPNDSAISIVNQTQLPLLGATFIAVLCFAPIGTSNDNTGEFCRSLFQVVGISLMLSWVLAVTITPVAGVGFLRAGKSGSDPYDNSFYRAYAKLMAFCLRFKFAVVGVMAAVLVLAVIAFSSVPQKFFPSSTSPLFTVDFWERSDTHIDKTLSDVRQLEDFIRNQPETSSVTGYAGQGALRFILTYSAPDPGSDYGQLVVEANTNEDFAVLKDKILDYAKHEMPHIAPQIRAFAKGSGGGAKIEARFIGQDAAELRRLGGETLKIVRSDPDATYERIKWGGRALRITPLIGDIARKSGLSRIDVTNALQLAYSGVNSGVYREGDKLMPIVTRLPESERSSPDGIGDTQIWSPIAGSYITMSEMVDGIETTAADQSIYRRDRRREFAVQWDSASDNTNVLFAKLRPQIEAIPLPPGITLEWGGEYESSNKAMGGLIKLIPVACVGILTILVMLFNNFSQPLIIVACLPLSIIGVAIGFVISGKSFDFVALLGFLSLMGMMIKNAIVLIDQINLETANGKEPYDAILSSGISRVRPVAMAAFTTVLGVVPLYFDILFGSLSVVVIFGLSFATLLTLIFVPVLCAIAMKA